MKLSKSRRAAAVTAASASAVRGYARAPAAGRLPVEPRHLRPGHRRRRGPHARVGVDRRPLDGATGAKSELATAVGRGRAPRRRGRASSASCSTAAATSITGASRRSPTAPVRADWSSERHPMGRIPNERDGRRPSGARRPDQPRSQGRQGRPALLVHGARRRRRRGRPGRHRLRQGQRGPGRHLQGGRGREEGHVQGAEAPQHRAARDARRVRRRPRAAEAREPRYRRDRRRRRARGAGARRHPRHPREVARHVEPDQPGARDRGGPARPAHAARGRASCAASPCATSCRSRRRRLESADAEPRARRHDACP